MSFIMYTINISSLTTRIYTIKLPIRYKVWCALLLIVHNATAAVTAVTKLLLRPLLQLLLQLWLQQQQQQQRRLGIISEVYHYPTSHRQVWTHYYCQFIFYEFKSYNNCLSTRAFCIIRKVMENTRTPTLVTTTTDTAKCKHAHN